MSASRDQRLSSLLYISCVSRAWRNSQLTNWYPGFGSFWAPLSSSSTNGFWIDFRFRSPSQHGTVSWFSEHFIYFPVEFLEFDFGRLLERGCPHSRPKLPKILTSFISPVGYSLIPETLQCSLRLSRLKYLLAQPRSSTKIERWTQSCISKQYFLLGCASVWVWYCRMWSTCTSACLSYKCSR